MNPIYKKQLLRKLYIIGIIGLIIPIIGWAVTFNCGLAIILVLVFDNYKKRQNQLKQNRYENHTN